MRQNMIIHQFLLRESTAFLAFLVLWHATEGAEPIGWRTNGTGNYPNTQPPLLWAPDQKVIWKTPMPGASNSIPVLVGTRILIASEPCLLLCLNREDGRILWQKSCSYADLELEPGIRNKLQGELAEADKIDKQVTALIRESEMLRKKLKEDPAAMAEIEAKLEQVKKQIDARRADKQKLRLALRYTEPSKQSVAGFSTPTPVTDGKQIIVAFGNGLVAAFDVDGNRQWLKLIEHSTAPFAHANSPVLVGDKVIIHFADMVALNTRDGSECWRLKKPPTHGTPIATRVSDTDVLVTPAGLLVRVPDGKVLAEGLGNCGASSPIVHDGVAYFIRNSATAVKLPSQLSDPLPKITALWKSKITGGGNWYPSPVLHKGLIYTADDKGIFSVVEAESGKLVYEERLNLGGTHYPSISVAGDRVYVSSDKGTTLVVQAGREFKELATNKLEPFRSSLVFDGKRMYVRTLKNLYCIGE